MNVFVDDPTSVDRVMASLRLMNRGEAVWFLRYRTGRTLYALHLARGLGIDTRGKQVSTLANDVYDYALASAPEVDPPMVEPDAPVVIAPEPPVVIQPPAGPICDGCGGVGDTPRFLRWAKVARGEAVTVSIDHSGKPDSLAWLTDEIIMREWFAPWEEDTSIRFRLLTQGKGDIHIKFEPIDGPGGTLGFAYLPNQSVEAMESGGDLSGDIVIDASDRWTSRSLVNGTGDHEVGHAIGIPHSTDENDPMYAYAQAVRRPHNDTTKRAKTLRYPPLYAYAQAVRRPHNDTTKRAKTLRYPPLSIAA